MGNVEIIEKTETQQEVSRRNFIKGVIAGGARGLGLGLPVPGERRRVTGTGPCAPGRSSGSSR